jgi:hypothetical protein
MKKHVSFQKVLLPICVIIWGIQKERLEDYSESFVSLVRSGRRSLTLNHLMNLEGALGIILPMILSVNRHLEEVPKELQGQCIAIKEFCNTWLKTHK